MPSHRLVLCPAEECVEEGELDQPAAGPVLVQGGLGGAPDRSPGSTGRRHLADHAADLGRRQRGQRAQGLDQQAVVNREREQPGSAREIDHVAALAARQIGQDELDRPARCGSYPRVG
jgi:hypothetical protein